MRFAAQNHVSTPSNTLRACGSPVTGFAEGIQCLEVTLTIEYCGAQALPKSDEERLC
jgi:hypothetical protein